MYGFDAQGVNREKLETCLYDDYKTQKVYVAVDLKGDCEIEYEDGSADYGYLEDCNKKDDWFD